MVQIDIQLGDLSGYHFYQCNYLAVRTDFRDRFWIPGAHPAIKMHIDGVSRIVAAEFTLFCKQFVHVARCGMRTCGKKFGLGHDDWYSSPRLGKTEMA